jgi:hypothetical protein
MQRGTTGNFSKIQNPPPTTPNFLIIVENLSSHENNCFQSIKTGFKKFGQMQRGDSQGLPIKGGPQEIFQKFKNHLKLIQTFLNC